MKGILPVRTASKLFGMAVNVSGWGIGQSTIVVKPLANFKRGMKSLV